jgi:hypothetical protein
VRRANLLVIFSALLTAIADHGRRWPIRLSYTPPAANLGQPPDYQAVVRQSAWQRAHLAPPLCRGAWLLPQPPPASCAWLGHPRPFRVFWVILRQPRLASLDNYSAGEKLKLK